MRSIVSAAGILAGVLALTAAPAVAQPSNDELAGATPIPGIPFSDTVDTTDATRAAGDPDCVGGDGHTVWYEFTPSDPQSVQADTFGSSYDTTLSVWTGSADSLTQIACNDDAGGDLQSRVRFEASAGETYYLMAGSFPDSGGGLLVLNLDVAPPPLDLGVDVDSTGSVIARNGTVTLTGTVTCSRPSDVVVFGDVEQRAGRTLIRGFFDTVVSCDGTTEWEATFEGENGIFKPGKADASVFAFAFDEEAFAADSTTVRLRGTRP